MLQILSLSAAQIVAANVPAVQFSVPEIVVLSAIDTLQILDRQAQRDCRKVWQFFTCRQAIQTYRSIYRLIEILCLIAIALGATAREMSDNYVASCERPIVAPLPDPWDLPAPEPETEPAAQPQLPAAAQPLALLPATIEQPTDALSDADLVAWAKQNRSAVPSMKKAIGKWSYSRKLREGERSAVLQAMKTALA